MAGGLGGAVTTEKESRGPKGALRVVGIGLLTKTSRGADGVGLRATKKSRRKGSITGTRWTKKPKHQSADEPLTEGALKCGAWGIWGLT